MPARSTLADVAPLTRASLAHPLAANVTVAPGTKTGARGAGPGVTDLASLPVGVLLDALADRVVDRLLTRTAEPRHPEHASARENPLGTARAFLDAGRRGDFPTFKRGREVVARWVDVLAYIERRAVARKVQPVPPSEVTSSTSRPVASQPFASRPIATKPAAATRASSPTTLSAAPIRTAPSSPAAPPAAPPATPETPDDRRRRLLRAANLLPPGH